MIDIIMATYNGGRYIREQIDSILNQTYKDIRIIIRDDGSSDDTIDIINEYQEKYPNTVVLVSDEVDCGCSKSNFMQAMKYSTADYVMFSDQDDYWLPLKIQHTFDRMIQIEEDIGPNKPILVFGSYRPVDSNLKDLSDKVGNRQVASYKLFLSNLLVQNYVNGCLMMINRPLANMMGDDDDRILMHDWWAALIASGCGVVEHIDEEMLLYRQHDCNVVGSVDVRSFSYIIDKLKNPSTKTASTFYYNQAVLLKERNYKNLSGDNANVLDGFLALFSKHKIARMVKLVKGNYLKSDIIRIIGQLWYI